MKKKNEQLMSIDTLLVNLKDQLGANVLEQVKKQFEDEETYYLPLEEHGVLMSKKDFNKNIRKIQGGMIKGIKLLTTEEIDLKTGQFRPMIYGFEEV